MESIIPQQGWIRQPDGPSIILISASFPNIDGFAKPGRYGIAWNSDTYWKISHNSQKPAWTAMQLIRHAAINYPDLVDVNSKLFKDVAMEAVQYYMQGFDKDDVVNEVSTLFSIIQGMSHKKWESATSFLYDVRIIAASNYNFLEQLQLNNSKTNKLENDGEVKESTCSDVQGANQSGQGCEGSFRIELPGGRCKISTGSRHQGNTEKFRKGQKILIERKIRGTIQHL